MNDFIYKYLDIIYFRISSPEIFPDKNTSCLKENKASYALSYHRVHIKYLLISLIYCLCQISFTTISVAYAAPIGAPEVFLNRNHVFIPTGIALDQGNNVFVYDSTISGSDVVHKFTPEGQSLGAAQVHSPFSTEIPGGFISRDPTTGNLFILLTGGEMRSMDSTTGEMQSLFHLNNLAIDFSTIYDVATSRSVEFSAGLLVPPFIWGDFSVLKRGQRLDFFISGKASAHVFIMRIRFENSIFQHAKGIVFSRLTTAGNFNLPRGVAVNQNGAVLTTLPVLTQRGSSNNNGLPLPERIEKSEECQAFGTRCFIPAPSPFQTCFKENGSACSVIINTAVTFSADFEPESFVDPLDSLEVIDTCQALPCQVPVVLLDRPETDVFDPIDITSLGIGNDSKGNFFIASGPVGSSQCGFFASGAMVVIPKSLNFLYCAPVSNSLINTSADVALTSDGKLAYMTVANLGFVASFTIDLPLAPDETNNCGGQTVVISDFTYDSTSQETCTATESLIASDVLISAGAIVIYQSPKTILKSGFIAVSGSHFIASSQ